jgi:hypothetical protein
MSEEWAVGYVLHFLDGGPAEEQLLHRGSRKECDTIFDHPALGGVAYSGCRPVSDCQLVICPVPGTELTREDFPKVEGGKR